MICEMSQTDAQQFLSSVDDGDEMNGYLNALPEDVVQDAYRIQMLYLILSALYLPCEIKGT